MKLTKKNCECFFFKKQTVETILEREKKTTTVHKRLLVVIGIFKNSLFDFVIYHIKNNNNNNNTGRLKIDFKRNIHLFSSFFFLYKIFL